MIGGEIKLKSAEPGQKEKLNSISLFLYVSENEVEKRGSGIENVMHA